MRRGYLWLGFLVGIGCWCGAEGRQVLAAERGPAGLHQALRDVTGENVVMCLAAQPEGVDADTLTYLRLKEGARVVVVVADWGGGCPGADACAGLFPEPAERARQAREAAAGLGWELYPLGTPEGGFDAETATGMLVGLIRETQPDTIITRHAADRGCALGRGIRLTGEEAFRLAASPEAFAEQLEAGLPVWQVKRFYERTRWPSNPTWEYDARVPVGEYDPVRGVSYAESAAERWPFADECGEGMEGDEDSGLAHYRLAAAWPPREEVDELLPDRAAAAALKEVLAGMGGSRAIGRWASAIRELGRTGVVDRRRLLDHLRKADEALAELADLVGESPDAGTAALRAGVSLAALRGKVRRAIAAVVGLETRIVACPEKVWPGAEFEVVTSTVHRWEKSLADVRVYPKLPDEVQFLNLKTDKDFLRASYVDFIRGGTAEPEVYAERLKPHQELRATFRFRLTEDAEFAASPPEFGSGDSGGLMSIITDFAVSGARDRWHYVETPVPTMGSPAVTVEVVPETPLAVYAEGREFMVQVRVTNHSDRRWPGSLVALRPPEGFMLSRQELPRVTLLPGETASVAYWVRPEGGRPGVHEFRGMVIYGLKEGQTYREADPAQLGNVVVEKAIAVGEVAAATDLKVGLIRTCGGVLEGALESLGVPYSVLEEDEVAEADLGRWDVIVVDAGAYGKRPELAEHYTRLIRAMWRGCHVVVMGHEPEGWDSKYPPYPLEVSRRPVAADLAVKFASPEHALVRLPNALAVEDFAGWEGPWGRLFAVKRDPAYTELLVVGEGGVAGLSAGGYLVAHYGYGSFIYTGYDWERQLRKGHVGAYRAFANMIAYPKYRKIEGGE